MENNGSLSVYCAAPEGCCEQFRVTIEKMPEGCECVSTRIRANEIKNLCLPEGCYQLRVKGPRQLSPGGISKWFCLGCGQRLSYHLMFRKEICPAPEVEVRFHVADANYPGLVPIHGGITFMANKQYTLDFVNGTATNVQLPVGTYTYVSNSINGYESGTVESFTITPSTRFITLEISAAGTLYVRVVDENQQPITAGEIRLGNQAGTPTGDPQPIENGVATFTNVPYKAYPYGLPITLRQNGSDASHQAITAPQDAVLWTNPQTEVIVNPLVQPTVDVQIEDANYPGLAELNGALVISG